MRQPITTPDGAGSLCVAIVETVADEEGVDPTELDVPLNDAVDVGALEALFAPRADGAQRRGRVAFDYCGYRVVVDSDRRVSVDPLDETTVDR
ncbi:HalOD1 output domain-containing protein [Haloarcula onubensis]|uniref:Halobacterial output domain-containing protein n=1 Tax=Haloarcula onubensis TaxID=2950539 RepID=A0ABU2FL10_9EURY|nr:HalOD1 output domain-containing protein [Halomicroarcula sp. S3CR25-11]MDS0281443.1 hypothetical protein [Halomicroarcula sp. S3CR25-11]